MAKGWYEFKNKRAESPHAALIIFISIMVISVIIAGTIVWLNNHMKNKAIEVGQETGKQVTTKFDVMMVEGYGAEDNAIDELLVYARLSGGSQAIKLDNLMLMFETEEFTSQLFYNNDTNYDNSFINNNHAYLRPGNILNNNSHVFTRNDYNNDFLQDNISIFTNCSNYNWTTCYPHTSSSMVFTDWYFGFIPPSYPNLPPGFTTTYYNRTRVWITWDTWNCDYWIYLQSRVCTHTNITYTTNRFNVTCLTNTSYANSFDSDTAQTPFNSQIITPNITTRWFINTSDNNLSLFSESNWTQLNVLGIELRSDTSVQTWIPSFPPFPPSGIPEGVFTNRWTATNITRWNYTDYKNITKITITNISNCTLFFLYSFWNTTEGCYNETYQYNFSFRYDDNQMDGFGFGNDSNSGISKWVYVENQSRLENFTLRIYGKADYCNETSANDYMLRVNNNVGQTLNFDWCARFGLGALGPLQNSSYAWINFSVPKSWILEGENKFNFWDTSNEDISNWKIGFDTDTAYGRSGYCSDCGTNPFQGQNMAGQEAMMYLYAINLTTEEINCTLVQHMSVVGNYTACDTRQITNVTVIKIQNATRYVTTNITIDDEINNTVCNYTALSDVIDGPHPQTPTCGPFGIGCSFFNVTLSNGSKYMVSVGTNLRDCGEEDDPLTINVTEAPCPVDIDYTVGQPDYPFSVDLHAHGTSLTKNTLDSGVDFYTVYRDSKLIWMGKYTAEIYQRGADYKKDLVNYGDTYIFHIFVPKPIEEYKSVKVKFVPSKGMPSGIELITPNVLVTDKVLLFPRD